MKGQILKYRIIAIKSAVDLALLFSFTYESYMEE